MKLPDAFASHWPAVDLLLDEALALPASAQGAWLDALVDERAPHREVLRTLLGHRQRVETDDLLGRLPSPRSEPQPLPLAADGRGPGRRVGAYRRVREIARGGMASVWRAERTGGPTPEPVALKLPRAGPGDDCAGHMARERRILATLEHPHIAELQDAGFDANGQPFLVLEHLDGEPIDTHCARRALALHARLELLRQVLAAVSHAHSRLNRRLVRARSASPD